MKLERLQPKQANGLPLYPIRITLDIIYASEIDSIYELYNIPKLRSGRCVYFNSEEEAVLFMLAYNE